MRRKNCEVLFYRVFHAGKFNGNKLVVENSLHATTKAKSAIYTAGFYRSAATKKLLKIIIALSAEHTYEQWLWISFRELLYRRFLCPPHFSGVDTSVAHLSVGIDVLIMLVVDVHHIIQLPHYDGKHFGCSWVWIIAPIISGCFNWRLVKSGQRQRQTSDNNYFQHSHFCCA